MGSGQIMDKEHANRVIAEVVRHSVDYAFLLLSDDGTITFSNVGAQEILRYSDGELTGLDIGVVFTDDDLVQNVRDSELRRALDDGRAEDERWHVRKNGERFWASGVMSCLRNENGKVTGFSKVFRDMTPRKMTEDEIKSANAELRQFAQTAAHDLQAPLRTVVTSLQFALRQSKSAVDVAIAGYMNEAIAAAKHMSELIQSILRYSEVGVKNIEQSNTNCNAVFDIAVSYLKPIIEENNAVITRGGLPDIEAIPTDIERVFQNLITNAIKYRGTGVPTLHIEAELKGSEWLFSARDNGIGIDAHHTTLIFKSFKRLHTGEDRPGTGLGLAICKKIIEHHGGRIWVESEVGKGSTFYFTLRRHLH